jgi:hypothetical protein
MLMFYDLGTVSEHSSELFSDNSAHHKERQKVQ